MTVKKSLVVLALLGFCGICHADEQRWLNFAEDSDLKYYLDQKSVQGLPDNVYLFWVKSVAKDRNFFRREYNVQNLSYVFTNYEMDCAVSSYRVRGSILFDKNRREISKTLPASSEPIFEPVPPESMLELAQERVCVKEDDAKDQVAEEPAKAPTEAAAGARKGATARLIVPELADEPMAPPEETVAFEPAPARTPVPVEAAAPLAPSVPAEPADSPAPPPVEVAAPAAPIAPSEPAAPAAPSAPFEPAAPLEPAAPDAPRMVLDRAAPGETPAALPESGIPGKPGGRESSL